MEETIKRIISIDKEAENYRKINEEILAKKRRELQNEIKTLTEECMRSIEIDKIRLSDDVRGKAEVEISEIKVNEVVRLEQITASFNNAKGGIEEEAFNSLIEFFKEV